MGREEGCQASHLPSVTRKGLKYCRKMAEFTCIVLLLLKELSRALRLLKHLGPGTAS